MKTRDGYALDLLSPVRHVATEMDKAGSSEPAPTVKTMTATYQHTITGDLARIRQHEGATSDYDARLWLISRAVGELGRQVVSDGNGGFRLAKPFASLKYKGRKVRPAVRAGEEGEKETLKATYHNLDKELRPFHVTVVGRNGSKEKDLTLHPLAHAIPRMTEREFADLAADMRDHGFRTQLPPIFTIKGKVIDGRHRLAIAAALKIPVRVQEFAGTEDEAVGHIISANVVRRHLTMAQRAWIVRQFLLPEAEAEAAKRLQEGREKGAQTSESLAPSGARDSAGPKASQIAAERSNGLATARTIERLAPVDDAPETQERIRRGEITTAAEARREALKETGADEPADLPALNPRTAYRRLGCALGDIRAALAAIEEGDRGDVTEETFIERTDEIKRALHDLRKLVMP